MNVLLVVLTLLCLSAPARAQQTDPPDGATVASAQVSGFDLGRLSPGLQQDIGRIAGGPLNREELKALAARIEEEQPRLVAAVRVFYAPADEVRVVFVVASMRDRDRGANINSRYLIDDVEIEGVDENELSAELRAALRALVGLPLGSSDVDEIEAKIRGELPDYDIRRRVRRGSRSGDVQLVFVARKAEAARWLRFQPLKSNAVYHSDQGWGALFDLPIGGRDVRFTPIIAIDNNDDLVEEYSGFGLRFESRALGTDRLGASFEFSSFEQDWRGETLAVVDATARLPRAYDSRSTITPLISFAVTRRFSVSGGVGITELEPLAGAPGSQMANAFLVAFGYAEQFEGPGSADQDLNVGFGVRRASAALESDFDYTRYFGQADYRYRRSNHTVLLSGFAGGISGDAPLFDRFSLGDSRTLRGWDKYDIAPAGGDRVFHASVEYRWHGLAMFLDTGSVWDRDTDARVRVSSGGGFHAGPFFMSVGFPLNTEDVRAVFTTGLRFGGIGISRY